MATGSTEYQNLVARGILKAAAKNADSIDQYVKTANDLPRDARQSSNSPHGVVSLLEAALPKVNEIIAHASKGRT